MPRAKAARSADVALRLERDGIRTLFFKDVVCSGRGENLTEFNLAGF